MHARRVAVDEDFLTFRYFRKLNKDFMGVVLTRHGRLM